MFSSLCTDTLLQQGVHVPFLSRREGGPHGQQEGSDRINLHAVRDETESPAGVRELRNSIRKSRKLFNPRKYQSNRFLFTVHLPGV